MFGNECGLKPDCFIDNNPELWGKTIEDIPIISIKELECLQDDLEIFITCKDNESIIKQLMDVGINRSHIRSNESILSMLCYILNDSSLQIPIKTTKLKDLNNTTKVIFDLANGLVLGGVETWSIQTAENLKKMGYQVSFITRDLIIKGCIKERKEEIPISRQEDISEWDTMGSILPYLVTEKHNSFVCNFIGYNFMIACLAKRLYPNSVQLIAVIHNDEEIYYKYYTQTQLLIDKCFVISEKMKDKMLQLGFPEEKLIYLPWKIPCEENLRRLYTSSEEALRIGYAGRIVVKQKRMDYLVSVIKKLRGRCVNFMMEIAGEGIYEEELEREIEKNDLQSVVYYRGRLENNRINDFWKKQDIMVSCSEWEGHSISQGEAMAAGAVPVITDVSGARDDIEDGENGFIVQVGDVEQIVEKICFLYNHRELLPVMGEKAYRTMKEKNKNIDLEKFWKSILL